MRTKKFIKWAVNGIFIFLLIILFTNFSYAETDITEDVTEKIELVKSRLMYDRLNKVSYLDVGLKNISQDVLLTPIKVVIDSITPATVTVANADGTTDNGKPYFRYDYPLLEKGQLDPEQTSPVKKFKFNNPNGQRFSYTTKIMAPLVPTGMPTPEETLSCAAKAIKDGDIEEALKMFSEGAHNKIRDLLNLLDSQGREEYAQALSTATLNINSEAPNTDTFKTYTTQIQVEGGGLVTVEFHMITLSNGNWIILNL